MTMNEEEMKKRTRDFGVRVIRLVASLPSGKTADVLGRQMLRSGTSVGANYRSACRGRTRAEFISKMNIALEEADESVYWMEMMIQADLVQPDRVGNLMQEGNELVAILAASIKTSRTNNK